MSVSERPEATDRVAVVLDGSIEAVVFDLGGVLIDWNPRHLYRQLFADEADMEDFLANVCSPSWHRQHDLGRDMAESCVELTATYPEHGEHIRAWVERNDEMVRGVIDGSVEILADLRSRGVPCYLLSNMESETFPRRMERFSFLRWFDGYVVSGHEGIAKPDPEVFQLLLERFDLEAARTIFVDDVRENVEAATRVGLQSVLFDSPAGLRAHLESAGLLPPDEGE